ncbi:MAG: conserved rane protein of unknown function [Betaproteobacteria bacterium]|nr:conserved rane protein of unknown function [Betaproteobacteria bacterium]
MDKYLIRSHYVYVVLAWSLTFLFFLRVGAQALQRWAPQTYLPAFNDFQGSSLPYWLLFASQLIILILMLRYSWRIGANRLAVNARAGKLLIRIGSIYMFGSLARVAVGLTIPAAPAWFTSWIPATFHLVLAAFVLTISAYHTFDLRQPCERTSMMDFKITSYLLYPSFVALAVMMFGALLDAGLSPLIAAYVPIILVGIAIVALELRFSERPDWKPKLTDIKADAAFMVAVQIALPRMLAVAFVIAVSEWSHVTYATSWWPQSWPLAIQIIAMVLLVDFLRYWLHRACHHFVPLWRLHEVHHSPDILYVLNVGRFHPFEKSLHFCLDTMPFLLLGVGPDVIAGYFLLYSVNGFFQHSNVRLHYGWLNYVVGSAETHRWHHARDPLIAACNFGNTTIVWDLMFRTWYLPKQIAVQDIGILDRRYPKDFWSQMAAPFVQR